MTLHSRAAVFAVAGRPHELRDVAVPPLEPGEVLVRVRMCTLCGSDLHTFQGARSTPMPTILGHEIVGEVAALGGDGKVDWRGEPVAVGDRITWSIAAHCGACYYCTHGLPQKCEALFKYGHERLTPARPLSGGLAEHCVLTKNTPLLKLPAALSDAVASLANCATATAAAALRVGELAAEENVLIFGAGMLGLTLAAMARQAGAAHVVVADVAPERLSRALQFGADVAPVFEGDGGAVVEELRKLTAGRGADLVVEAAGSPEAMEAALKAARIGGRIVFVGAVRPTRPLAVDAEQIVRRLLTIRGLHNYTPDDLVTAVDFLAAAVARFPFAEMISEPYPLEMIGEAFEAGREGKSLRVAVRP